MGRKALRTITDYMAGEIMVRIQCRSCGHAIELEPTGACYLFMARRLSLHTVQAARKFRCSKCRMKNCEIVPGRLVPDGDARPLKLEGPRWHRE